LWKAKHVGKGGSRELKNKGKKSIIQVGRKSKEKFKRAHVEEKPKP